MQQALTVAPITSNQHRYSLLHREIEATILPFSSQHQIGVLAWSPLVSGFLTDNFTPDSLDPADFRRQLHWAQEPMWSKVKTLRHHLQQIAHDHQQSMVNLALAWVLRDPAITGAIVGIRNEDEARTMLGGARWQLTSQEIAAIEHFLV
jgi:aryl-alcohol dehydrogenase-like predicted oxidoreductase